VRRVFTNARTSLTQALQSLEPSASAGMFCGCRDVQRSNNLTRGRGSLRLWRPCATRTARRSYSGSPPRLAAVVKKNQLRKSSQTPRQSFAVSASYHPAEVYRVRIRARLNTALRVETWKPSKRSGAAIYRCQRGSNSRDLLRGVVGCATQMAAGTTSNVDDASFQRGTRHGRIRSLRYQYDSRRFCSRPWRFV
jgi:hypothetical protein